MKKILLIIAIIIAVVIIGLNYLFYKDTKDPYVKSCDYSVPAELIPTFGEVSIDFKHHYDGKKSLPLQGAALIDVDGDGVDELFVGGGLGQVDALFRYGENGFVNIGKKYHLPDHTNSACLGAVSCDLDADGRTDLLVSSDAGVFYYRNTSDGFKERKLDIALNDKSTPATMTLGDVDRDGDLDIFLCNYIKKEKMEGQTIFNDKNYGASSLLLKNNGDATFEDVTSAYGLTYIHNTFQAVLTDVDNDGWLDLVVAYDTGEPRFYKNENGGHFSLIPNPASGKFSYPMGIAVGDFNNDLKTDFFFSNTGSSVPEMLAKGDLRDDQQMILDWMLFKNNGNFVFEDVAQKVQVADYEFSWGCVFEDFNLDGLQDLAVAENYIDFPPHMLYKLPCRLLIQRQSGVFSSVEEQAGITNEFYAISPLVSDFNGDGYSDVVYINLDGPVRAFINKGGNNNFLRVRFPETARWIGSSVHLFAGDSLTLSDVYVLGEGLGSDQTNVLTFGLGDQNLIDSIQIIPPGMRAISIEHPKLNSTLDAEAYLPEL